MKVRPSDEHRHEWVVNAETGQMCCLTCSAVIVDVIDVVVDVEKPF